MMNFNAEMIEKAKMAKSAEELLEIAKANGVEMTEEEANAAEDFEHDPWSGIEIFIAKNFETIKIDEEYEIKY